MKWAVLVVALLAVFVAGFGLGWTLHKPIETERVTTPVATHVSPVASAPNPLPTFTAQSSTWIEDTEPFAWPSAPAPAHQVVAVDATHYLIDRGFIGDVSGDQSKRASPRIVPEQADGKVAGIRIFGLRPDSPYAKIGLQNGDRVDSVNGIAIADPSNALDAYTKMKGATRLGLAIVRHGAPMTLHYLITE